MPSSMESLSAVVLDITQSRTPGLGQKPKGTLTLGQMLMLNAVVCGVEICACAGFTYIPPLLLKAGYTEENLGYLLGMGPLLGFFLVPVIGRASDRCYSQFGRRRPFILGLASLLVISLYLIPFGEYFASMFVNSPAAAKRMGVWWLTMGVVLLDFTTQACLTPCEALLNDASRDSDQNEKIFTIYSLMISSGGIIGYLLTAIDWTTNPLGEYFGGQEASIFSILIIIFTLMLFATLFVAKEVPLSAILPVDIATVFISGSPPHSPTHKSPPAIKELTPNSPNKSSSSTTTNHSQPLGLEGNIPKSMSHHESGYESSGNSSVSDEDVEEGVHHHRHNNSTTISNNLSPPVGKADLVKQVSSSTLVASPSGSNVSCLRSIPICPSRTTRCVRNSLVRLSRLVPCCQGGVFITGLLGCLYSCGKQMMPTQLSQIFKIPVVLKMLALADFCSWTAIMGFNIYYTDYVGQVVYGGNPNAPETSPESHAYDEGVRIASWGLLLHCICSAIFSFFIERLTNTYGYKTTFTLGMVTFVFAMMGMVLIRHIIFVNLMAAVTGFAYSTITTIPFMLISKYHDNKHVYFQDLPPALLSESERGIGADMAVLDWAYFLSQVVLTAAMGTIVHLTGTLVSYMVTAGTMGILAIYYIGRIVENEPQARRCVMDASSHSSHTRR